MKIHNITFSTGCICIGLALTCLLNVSSVHATVVRAGRCWARPFERDGFRIESLERGCGRQHPVDISLTFIKSREKYTIKKALTDPKLFQLRNNRYLYYVGLPENETEPKKVALMYFDLQTGRTAFVFDGLAIAEFEISPNERRAALVDVDQNLYIFDLGTKTLDLILKVYSGRDALKNAVRYDAFTWPSKPDNMGLSLKITGWSDNDEDLWFMLYSIPSGAIFGRVRDGLIEEYDQPQNIEIFYGDYYSTYQYAQLKKEFNANTGRWLHSAYFPEWGTRRAVTDLVEQKTAAVPIDCSNPQKEWLNDEEFRCDGAKPNGSIVASDLLCIQQ